MKPLVIEGTDVTPEIVFNPENCLFEISGCSRPEDVRDFYYPVLNWLEKCKNKILEQKAKYEEKPITFNFKFSYFNSSSAKFIFDIITEINTFYLEGINIKIYWCFDEGDDDMKEAGEDLSEMCNIPFNYITIKH